MTITVSISDFRDNISEYFEKVAFGNTIIIKDKKKNKELAQVIRKKQFDPEAFEKALRRAAGTFTAENHPEWRTKRDVIRWLQKSRKADDRSFDYIK